MGNSKELRHLGLCSGYGGIERGLELAGEQLRTLAHVEIEAFAIANLVSKMEAGELDPCPIWTDLKTLPLAPFRGCVDLLTGGYPCQPFSSAGRRRGKDDPRHLWPWICRIIDGIMPRMCFFENVEGHISLGLRQVLADLEARGYETAWGIFSAEEVGAPHRRKRVFILGDSSRRRSAMQQKGDRARKPETQARVRGSDPRNEELAHTKSERTNGKARPSSEEAQGSRGALPQEFERASSGPKELANSERRGCGKDGISGSVEAIRRGKSNNSMSIEESNTRWPARPGEEQYEWEQPRTIKPELGGAVDGSANRVDRLRLLGNGVVPQTAAKAWVTLKEGRKL